MPPRLSAVQGAVIGAACLATGLAIGTAGALSPDVQVEPLLDTRTTVLGEQIRYPEGDARVTAAVVTLAPGARTGWHSHDVPLFGWILEGELTVDYGEGGTRTYRKGDALVEALGATHEGVAGNDGQVRALVVFMGAEGSRRTIPHAH